MRYDKVCYELRCMGLFICFTVLCVYICPSIGEASLNIDLPINMVTTEAEEERLLDVSVFQDSGWQYVGSLAYRRDLTSKSLDLSQFAAEGALQVRLAHRGETGAYVDSIFLEGKPPVSVSGASEPTALVSTKLARTDYDVIDISGRSLDILFDNLEGSLTFSITARIEPDQISTIPFLFPLENILTTIDDSSSFYVYKVNDSSGKLTIDGDLDAESLEEPFFKVFSSTGSGHPSDYTYGWVRNDASNLYVAIDFVPDNTIDGDKDYSSVFVNTPGGIKEFRASVPEQQWGKPGFTYTTKAAYQHKTYEFQIPFSEIGTEAISNDSQLKLAFAAYGTAAPGFDYGDAPDSYGTLAASNGASHGPDQSGYWYLGYCSDYDIDGMPSPLADGDDFTLGQPLSIMVPCQGPDDEDGVTFVERLVPGQSSLVEIGVGLGPPGFRDECLVMAYIDFNSNGIFDPDELVFYDILPPGDIYPISVPIPQSAVIGQTYARFRCASPLWPTPPIPSPTGNLPNGEVEDYLIEIRYAPGDYNGDGTTDLKDVILVLKLLSGAEGSSSLYLAGDTNNDGQITMADIIEILKSL